MASGKCHSTTHNTCGSGKHYPPILINAAKESRSVELESVTDKQVRKQIDYYNDHLKILNRNVATPRLSQDQILSNKGRKIEGLGIELTTTSYLTVPTLRGY